MQLVPGSFRIVAKPDTDPVSGAVKWKPAKSIWIGAMTIAALVLGPLTISWSALAVFLVLCGITLCAGHSVGMHRRMIHQAFECPLWLEYMLIELGVLVGMAGPFGMIRQHDVRDWAQRQSDCHDLGLVWNVQTPETIPPRPALMRLETEHAGWKALRVFAGGSR